MECLLVLCSVVLLGSSSASQDFAGKEFAFSFMQNYKPKWTDPRLSITIIAQQMTKVKVHVPSLNFLQEEFLQADKFVTVRLPVQLELYGSTKCAKTVLVEASEDVTVTSFNYKEATADTALIFPISKWGTEYFVFTPSGTPKGEYKEFSVTNGKENNRVEINLKGAVMYEGRSYSAGQQLVVDLGPYESLQLQSSEDLTGSGISSQKPVGVLSGHTCSIFFGKCNHVYEQLLPVSSWGTSFIVPSLSFQKRYDSIFIQASQPTKVAIRNGKRDKVERLDSGQSLEVRFDFPDVVTIKAEHGVQVLMIFNGAKLRRRQTYDSFLMTILPMEFLCSSYSLVTQRGFTNFGIIVVRTAQIEDLSIDGNAFRHVVWRDVKGTDFSFSEVALRPEPVRIVSSSSSSFALYGIGLTARNAFGSPAQCRRPAVKSAICWAQGDPHYRTFDDRRFDFMGTCTYLITKNCEENTRLPTFEVSAQNEHRGNRRVSYVGLVTVKVAGFTITAVQSEIGQVRVDNNRWSLPLTLNEGKLQIFQSGRSVLILTDFGLLVRYDWKSLLVVTMPSSFAGKTCGLCGNFNGDPKDDLFTPEGRPAAGVSAFGASWKVPGLVRDNKCTDECVGQGKTCNNKRMWKWGKKSSCGLMTHKRGPFSKCHAAVDPLPYLENCKFDVCMNDGIQYFLCKSMESYADSCQEAGVEIGNWRTKAMCPYKCPANSQYQQCGSACPATCSNQNAPSKCTLQCLETCTCNKGFVLIKGHCMPAEKCGCTHEGRYMAPGQSYWADDNCQKRCTCNAKTRSVQCQDVSCRGGTLCQVLKGIRDCHPVTYGRCRATGDPHYTTFDKKKFDFMGTCVYQMVKHSMGSDLEPFEVLVQNDHRGSKVVSYTKLVEVKAYSLSIVISRTHKGLVMVNGELANLPLSLAEGLVSVFKNGRYAVVSTNFGLRVSFDWERALFVALSSSYMGQVSGLCGNYNGKAEDDLTPKGGSIIVSQADFGASWQVEKIPGCVDNCQGKCPSCDIIQKRQYETGAFCGILKDPKGPFRDCHSKVDPADYFEDCVFDVCLFKGRKEVLCQAITSYTSACQDVGAEVYSWRTQNFCEMTCPSNSHYETCADACPANCQGDLASLGCEEPCSEGCVCDEDFVLSGEHCVPISKCGCVEGERYYTLNQVFYPDGKCDKECRCGADGEVECRPFSCGQNEECKVQKGKRKCQAVGAGTCLYSGDVHYRTFDGRAFDLQGTCTYTLSKTSLMNGTHLVAFAVRVENNSPGQPATKHSMKPVTKRMENNTPGQHSKKLSKRSTQSKHSMMPITKGMENNSPGQHSMKLPKHSMMPITKGMENNSPGRHSMMPITKGMENNSPGQHSMKLPKHLMMPIAKGMENNSPGQHSMKLPKHSMMPITKGMENNSPGQHSMKLPKHSMMPITKGMENNSPGQHSMKLPKHSMMPITKGMENNSPGQHSMKLPKHLMQSKHSMMPITKGMENNSLGQPADKHLMMPITKGVALDVYGYTIIMRNTVSGVLVNGVLHHLPLSLKDGAVRVYQKGVHYVMATDFGLLLTYDRTYLVTLTVPGNYKGHTSGLCGNFNDNPKDDLHQPHGGLTEDLNVFAGSWEVRAPGVKCERGCHGNSCFKCTDHMASNVCAPIAYGHAFKEGRAKVNPKLYFDNCAVDSCASKGDSRMVCNSIAAYAFSCHMAGANVNWRTDTLCPMKCAANSHYEACSDNCGIACPGLTDVVDCAHSCIEGCTCDDGFLFNGQSCVPLTECGCYEDGVTYKQGEVMYREDCKQKCRCDADNGFVCEAHTCPANSECLVKKGLRGCFTKDPCETMSCTTQERCVVREGQGVCIPMPTASCWAWGDPHFRTFDGYNYEFQGTCRYVYATSCGDMDGLVPFSITERNGHPGVNDAANVKGVEVSVYGFSISAFKNQTGRVLVNGELVNIPIRLGDGEVKITYKSGCPLIVADFGLQVLFEWDWKVVVILPRTYQGRACGLCGNFNGDRKDELRTPENKVVSTVQEWARSWMAPNQEGTPCFHG